MATFLVQIDGELLKRVEAMAAERGLSVESLALESLADKTALPSSLRGALYNETPLLEMGTATLRSQIYR